MTKQSNYIALTPLNYNIKNKKPSKCQDVRFLKAAVMTVRHHVVEEVEEEKEKEAKVKAEEGSEMMSFALYSPLSSLQLSLAGREALLGWVVGGRRKLYITSSECGPWDRTFYYWIVVLSFALSCLFVSLSVSFSPPPPSFLSFLSLSLVVCV